MSDTLNDIINDALQYIGVYGATLPAPADTEYLANQNLGMRTMNRELDSWAALDRYAYNVTFSRFTLVPNLAPHTIGPSGATFTVSQRPVKIVGASLILNNVTPEVDSPIINIRDDQWWLNQRVKGIKTSIPTDLYYSPDFPLGQLNFWPIPTFAYDVRLEMWGLLTQFTSLSTSFVFPPGYRKALVLTLAEQLCSPFGRQLSPKLIADANASRVILQSNNAQSPRISSADVGTQGSRTGMKADFNYYTGLPST
jgi:hypothetical protein